MVVISIGHPFAVLSAVKEETLEETLAAVLAASSITAVSEIQRRSVERGADGMSRDEIHAEIAAIRKRRRQRQESAE